jgi:tetratricopeptide (TPR) repeat protein
MVQNNKENIQTDLNKIDEAINSYGQKMVQKSHVDTEKKADETAEAYERAFKINMQNLDKLKKSDEATKAYEKTIEINPQD